MPLDRRHRWPNLVPRSSLVADAGVVGDGGRSERRTCVDVTTMSGRRETASFSLLDFAWRTTFRLGFPLARIWWRLWRQHHEGALVAIYVRGALLVVRSSYRVEWNFPGGTVRRREPPEAAARRELAEEIGLTASALFPAGIACGIWDGRLDRVHFFE